MVLAISRPWRHPKAGTYWYRRRVPKELQLLLGRTEEKATLRTKEPAIARVRYLAKAMEVEKRWARLRAGEAALASAPLFGEFRLAHVRDERGAFDARRAADIPSSDPIAKEPILPIAMTGVGVPWRPVFEAYASEAQLAPSTVKRWSGVMDTLENDLGTDDLAAVTPEFLLAWKASLIASGRSPGTVRDAYLGSVKAVMNWAVANRRIAVNPVLGITVKVPKAVRLRDRDFTDDEAHTILKAASGPPNPRLSPAMRPPVDGFPGSAPIRVPGSTK